MTDKQEQYQKEIIEVLNEFNQSIKAFKKLMAEELTGDEERDTLTLKAITQKFNKMIEKRQKFLEVIG